MYDADKAKTLPSADDTEEIDAGQSWPGFFWLPPAGAGPNERDMLHLDDELAGLVEAADMPAAQAGAHPIQREPASSVPGEVHAAFIKSAVEMCTSAMLADALYAHWHTVASSVALCCVVLFAAVLQYCTLCLWIPAQA